MRFGGIGLNPKDAILDPEFFGGDPGGQHGDFLVAGGEGRVGQICGEKTEAARPVFLAGALIYSKLASGRFPEYEEIRKHLVK